MRITKYRINLLTTEAWYQHPNDARHCDKCEAIVGEIFVIDMANEIFQYLQRNRKNILVFGKFLFIHIIILKMFLLCYLL